MWHILLFLISTHAIEWYSTRNLDENTKTSLIKEGCFRGSYGIREDLHLFNCLKEGVEKLHPFAVLPFESRLLVVESREKERVMMKLKEYQHEIRILLEDGDDIVIGSTMGSDVPSLCSRSDFEGAAWNVIPVPTSPMALPIPVEDFIPGAPIPAITQLVNSVSQSNLQSTVNYLANTFHTRLSPSPNATAAVNWAATQYRNYGFSVTLQTFNSSMCQNIIATKTGATNQIVLIGSHIDSRSTSSTNQALRAPGADDNGSGMAVTLELARLLNASTIRLNATLILAAFCGEEQGLLGSNYMSAEYKRQNASIIGMYNADMIGYRCGSSSTLTFDSRGVSTGLTNTCKGIVPDYVTGYPIGDNSGCCSDNQGFQNQGYQTVSFF